jgi:type II secretory pathway pseudopilin PulG
MPSLKDRRRAQAGTTLVELLVSLVIISLALALVIGTISSGLLDATLAKRNTAVEAVTQYEMEKVSSSVFDRQAPPSYSDCFATEKPATPTPASGSICPSSYSLRADVSWGWMANSSTVQTWTIKVISLNTGSAVGTPISLYKVTYT